jgi:glyoxylate reductase
MPKKPIVLLTSPLIPSVIRSDLLPHAHVIYAHNKAALFAKINKADALITLLTTSVEDALLKHAKNLKVVGNFAVGFNNIDLKACHDRGIRVVNTPDVLTRATAELAIALIFGIARRVYEGDKLCRSGKFKGLAPDEFLGFELKGRHAVLLGEGRIGTETGSILRALGLSVEFIDRDDAPEQIAIKLKRAQIFSIHCPLTPETRGWLNARRIALLPQDSIVINTSRGPVVDEKALIQALKKRKIFGAGLDVYTKEPTIPSELRRLPNTLLLPHIGSATERARTAMARLVVSGVLTVLDPLRSGEVVPNEVKFGN